VPKNPPRSAGTGANLPPVRELTPELRALYDLARGAAQGGIGVDELLERVCVSVVDSLGFERCGVGRFDPETGVITPVVSHGVPREEVPTVNLDEQPLLQRALEQGEAVLADARDSEGLSSALTEQFGVVTVLAVPLLAEGRCLGFLAADRGGGAFELDESALDLMTTIGAVGGVLLHRALESSELENVNEVARNFIALASHELRTPAAVVHGIASTLHLRGDLLDAEQLHHLRATLYQQTDRLRRLVDQLLDLSRLEANAVSISVINFPVRRRVEELVLMLAADHVFEIELRIDPSLETVADPEAFDRIVSNLLTNALRYGKPPVSVDAQQTDRHFRLAVEDHGDGVAGDFVPHLFERFARGSPAGHGAIGSGLGLSIAQSYARAHGGDLLYGTASPSGARFELVLPVS
jgi:signal transduction histidine kinase